VEDPDGLDDVEMMFVGHSTGLIGGVDPVKISGKVLSGIVLQTAPLPRTDPSVLHRICEFFFVVYATAVTQKGRTVNTRREPIAPVGYCKGYRISNTADTWSLECNSFVNIRDKNYFRFISDGSIPPPLKGTPQSTAQLPSKSGQSTGQTKPSDMDETSVKKLEPVVREVRACIRKNLPSVYQSGAYGSDQVTAFFKTLCFSPYLVAFQQVGFSELADSSFSLLVTQEVAPQEWQRLLENVKPN
jgi:hypothetical protein